MYVWHVRSMKGKRHLCTQFGGDNGPLRWYQPKLNVPKSHAKKIVIRWFCYKKHCEWIQNHTVSLK